MIKSAIAIIPTFSCLFVSQDTLPSTPTSSVLVGGAAGALMASITNLMRRPPFPETMVDYTAIGLHRPYWSILKTSMGYATLFTVYQGLVSGIDKGRWIHVRPTDAHILADPSWHFTNFFAGGISGLAYRAATLPMFRGLHENPIVTRAGIRLLGSTFMGVGAVMASSSAIHLMITQKE